MSTPITLYGSDILKRKTTRVGEITPELRQLALDMVDTMHEANGVGLAAPQISRSERMCVIDVPADAEDAQFAKSNAEAVAMPLVMFNPDITKTEGSVRRSEGCLSFPDVFVSITRPAVVTVEYTDIEGARRTITVQGLLARAVLHEVDHLEGVTLVDRMSQPQRMVNARRLKRIREEAELQ